MSKPPYLSLVEPWQTDAPTSLHRTRVFTLREHRARSRVHPDKSGSFVYLDTGDWVNVIALTADERVVLVEQYRHGLRRVTLEIPGGMVDGDEDPLAAGQRELREESGYAGTGARLIGRVSPNPAILTNWCHTVLVPEVTRVGEPHPEGTEELGVRLVPLVEIGDLIRQGVIHHALVVAAFHHLTLLR
jgi:8-oxo-dGTP pyrophosphatase MutT (NUDIX family)